MARRPNKHLRPPRPLSSSGAKTYADKADGRWITRPVAGARATKQYRCPGCNQPVQVGVAHIVVWPARVPLGSQSGLEHRRHWHNGCWERRR